MKIAVTSLGENVDSPVDQRFGRACFFILYDTKNEQWTVHENSVDPDTQRGAGIQAGQRNRGDIRISNRQV